MLVLPPMLREVALFEDVFKNSSDVSDVVSVTVVEKVRCKWTLRQLRRSGRQEKKRTLNRELPRVVHARYGELEEVENCPTREVSPQLRTLRHRRPPSLLRKLTGRRERRRPVEPPGVEVREGECESSRPTGAEDESDAGDVVRGGGETGEGELDRNRFGRGGTG
jgi:hypothetical protein